MRHLLALALLSAPLLANGTIEVRGDAPGTIALTQHSVTGKIRDQLAEVTVEQVFLSHGTRRAEGVYLFPLPKAASVSAFEMTVDGKTMRGEVVERQQARRIYEDIVRRRQDPALLEKVGDELFRARVFPIDPEKEIRIRLTYQQLLEDHDGLLELRYPLARQRMGAALVERVDLRFEIESSIDLVSVASPSHGMKIEQDGKRRAWLTGGGAAGAQENDFLLRIQRDPKAIGFTLIGDAESKTFLAILSPPTRLPEEQIPPRDLVYVVDTSGSMNGAKLKQAQAALKRGVSLLRARDRFRILSFATGIYEFRDGWTDASDGNKQAALTWIDQLDANGGTAINDALAEALAAGDPKRLTLVVFLTDGLPTVGEVEPRKIVANVKARNTASMRIFCFGVGFDQGVPFLDEIATSTRASREYVTEEENLEAALVRFFDRVQQPALSDLGIGWGSGGREVYPHPLPDLFAGDRLVVAGCYENAGPCLVKLKGTRLGQPVELTYEGTLPERGGVPAVARLWAQKKIDFLLAEIARNGPNAELKDAIVSLGTKHHIVTPYTAGLVVEDEPVAQRGVVTGGARGTRTGDGSVLADDVPVVDTDSEFEETVDEEGISDEPFVGPSTNSAIGIGGGGSSGMGGARNLRAAGGTSIIEPAVELHLKWLEAQQDPHTGAIGDVEGTSLALLAFLGAGYTDRGSVRENRYGKTVRAALRFLIASQGPDGSLADRSRDGWVRFHAVATLALADAFRLTRNPRYKKPAQDGLDLLARIRVANGGWDEGVMTMVWALTALRTGRLAGLTIDPDALAGSRLLIEKHKSALVPAEQAVALLARIFLGENPRDSADCKALADELLAHLPTWRDDEAPPLDLWYFGTMAMFHMGGAHWKQWNEAMVDAIVKRQRRDDAGDLAGSWPIPNGTVGDQARLATCLEVYYRYDRVFGVR